jgi:signal transduction histidine kinase
MTKRLLTPSQCPPGQPHLPAAKNAELQARPVAAVRPFPAQSVGLPAILHRLSQPLTALRGSLELGLLTEGSAADYRLALQESLAQADSLAKLLASLRDLVDAEASGNLAEPTPLELLVQAASQEMRPWATSLGLTLHLESAGHCTVRADSRWLRQAIYRVIHRAIERSPEGGTVLISLSQTDYQAFLRVSDQGPAAPPGELDHLSQVASLGELFSDAAKRATLEWALAKHIFEVQGGTVRVESKLGGGCCFIAGLPLTPTSAFRS